MWPDVREIIVRNCIFSPVIQASTCMSLVTSALCFRHVLSVHPPDGSRCCLSARRFGSRTDAPSGRRGRRPPMCSAPRGRCCQHRACHSSLPRPPWRTACAPSTPTTLAGPRGCRECPSCSSRRPLVVSQACRDCHSAVWVRARHQTPWVSPTACPPTAPVCSPTSTSRLSPECRPLSPAPRT